ncbi:Imm1 family immunity protein [Allokutzneria sp. A3M-2-11 16]|uniref:Imm1 family immunity protein n=1 Tax=Allokutzneria sp. A3M-2-11 16 TaxID=2962043 RepID=UPI0020B8A095|nr:Imm1 family immunity protein [Allokutzneria sp. A3M-2-11 16]MCP3802345.1 Imm1 family immunity protein [Allokutzneria sp. A3M-2-11 16]
MTVLHAWYDVRKHDAEVLDGVEATDEFLTRLAVADDPVMVALFRADDLENLPQPIELLVGIGGGPDVGIAQCSDDDGIWVSSAPEDSGWDAVSYSYMGTGHDFPNNAPIPLPQIRAAVHEFAATGNRPETIAWQQLR